MRPSLPISSAAGSVVALVQRGDLGWFLIALDSRISDLDRQDFPSPEAAERVARLHLAVNHPLAPPLAPPARHAGVVPPSRHASGAVLHAARA